MEVITNKKSANSKSQAGETFKWQPRVFPTSYVRSAHRPFTRRKLTFTSYPRALLEFAWSRVAPLSHWILTPREETAHHGIVQGHFFPSTLAGLKDVRTYSSCQVFKKKKKKPYFFAPNYLLFLSIKQFFGIYCHSLIVYSPTLLFSMIFSFFCLKVGRGGAVGKWQWTNHVLTAKAVIKCYQSIV